MAQCVNYQALQLNYHEYYDIDNSHHRKSAPDLSRVTVRLKKQLISSRIMPVFSLLIMLHCRHLHTLKLLSPFICILPNLPTVWTPFMENLELLQAMYQEEGIVLHANNEK